MSLRIQVDPAESWRRFASDSNKSCRVSRRKVWVFVETTIQRNELRTGRFGDVDLNQSQCQSVMGTKENIPVDVHILWKPMIY
jgi:hypothetical protein